MRSITLIDAIREAYQEEMRRDEDVFLVGQDIRGAIFPHTKGAGGGVRTRAYRGYADR